MASITTLPTEVLLLILGELDYGSEVSAVAQTCHRLCDVANDHLYSKFAKTYSPQSLDKIIGNGNSHALYKLLLAGVEFNNPGLLEEAPKTTLLRLAASKSHVQIVNVFANFFGYSAVTEQAYEVAKAAVENGCPAILAKLLWLGAYLDIPDESNLRTILSQAAGHGQVECLEVLIDNNCSVNTCDVSGQTPLWWACKEGHLETVKMLVEAGADAEITSSDAPFAAPIYCAALNGHRAIVEYLLEIGAHPKLSPTANIRALNTLVINELDKKDTILPLLFDPVVVREELGWCCDDQTRYRLLMCAVAGGYEDLVQEISKMGCKAGPWGDGYCEPIEIAVRNGYSDIAAWLIANEGERGSWERNSATELAIQWGASAATDDMKDIMMMSMCDLFVRRVDASTVSAALAHPSLIDYLLDKRVLRNFKDEDEYESINSIIREALSSPNLKALGRILQWSRTTEWSDVGPFEHDYIGLTEYRHFTLMEAAAVIGRIDTFNFILNKPWKRPTPAEKRWRSVLHFAAKHKRVGIVRVILDSGFDVNGPYGEGERDVGQPLLMSFLDRRGLVQRVDDKDKCIKEGVRLLVAWGADINVMNTKGRTALARATRWHDVGLVKELLRLGANPFAGERPTSSAFYKALTDNSSPITIQLVEMLLEAAQVQGRHSEIEKFIKSQSGDEAAHDTDLDPQPGELGLSEENWIGFQKMKRVRSIYWRQEHPVPGFGFTNNW